MSIQRSVKSASETKRTDMTVLPDVALRPDWNIIAAPIIQALLRSTKQGVLMTDHAKNDILCNPRFAELFDVDPELVVNLPGSEADLR
jgi:PAS domain-containing protein